MGSILLTKPLKCPMCNSDLHNSGIAMPFESVAKLFYYKNNIDYCHDKAKTSSYSYPEYRATFNSDTIISEWISLVDYVIQIEHNLNNNFTAFAKKHTTVLRVITKEKIQMEYYNTNFVHTYSTLVEYEEIISFNSTNIFNRNKEDILKKIKTFLTFS